VVVVLLVGCACSSPETIDADAAERDIRDYVRDSFDVRVTSVSCPGSVEVAQGRTFGCTARIDRARSALKVTVRQRDDEGSLDVMPASAVLVANAVEADIARELADRFARDDVTVTCPGADVRVAAPGATFTCTALDGPDRKTVTVTVRDPTGSVTYHLE
jgi:hypothetical protein